METNGRTSRLVLENTSDELPERYPERTGGEIPRNTPR